MSNQSTDLRLSFSDIANMTLLGEESFYRCEVIDAEFAAKDAEIARLRGVFSKIIGLSDLEMRDGDTARELAQSALDVREELVWVVNEIDRLGKENLRLYQVEAERDALLEQIAILRSGGPVECSCKWELK